MAPLSGTLLITAVSASSLPDVRFLSSMNPVLVLELRGQGQRTPPAKSGGRNPKWAHTFTPFELPQGTDAASTALNMHVLDSDGSGKDSTPVAHGSLPLASLVDLGDASRLRPGESIPERQVRCHLVKDKDNKAQGEVVLNVTWTASAAVAPAAKPFAAERRVSMQQQPHLTPSPPPQHHVQHQQPHMHPQQPMQPMQPQQFMQPQPPPAYVTACPVYPQAQYAQPQQPQFVQQPQPFYPQQQHPPLSAPIVVQTAQPVMFSPSPPGLMPVQSFYAPPQQQPMYAATAAAAVPAYPYAVPAVGGGSADGVINFNELIFTRLIGDGTFGTVHAGEFHSTPVAIKLLKQRVFTPSQSREFLDEVKYLREARHPNIVLFMGVTFNPYAIVTELLDTSLFNVLHQERRVLSPQQKLHVSLGIARGLASLHATQPVPIVHRDIKSLNVLVSKDLRDVKICDLGMVKLKAVQGQRLESNGTPLWMSPECLLDQPYDEMTDVYSYGCVLYELLTGSIPFGGGNFTKQDLAVRIGQRGERPQLPPGMQTQFRDLLVQCWQQHPQARPTMRQVVATLAAIQL